MKKIIIACILLITITIINFQKETFVYLYNEHKFKQKYHEVISNKYSLNYDYSYIKDVEKEKLENKQDIINSIYHLLNSGTKKITRYCSNKYKDCSKDIEKIAKDKETLSDLNNFVHPFNTFEKIKFEFDSNITLTISNTTIYNDATIKILDDKIDDLIKMLSLDGLSLKEKLLKIHDYIINNTKYDLLKAGNINDNTYSSNTAYGVLIEGYGICSGYSDALSIFLNKLNIPNYKISNNSHVWNLVKIDNSWYHIDLTWDDPILSNGKDAIKHDYFLIDTKKIQSLDNRHSFNLEKYKEASS